MPDFIRVTDEVKPYREYSIVESTFDPKVHKKLDKPAAHTDGTALPPKYTPESLSSSTSGGTPASASSGQKAKSDKEEEAS